MAESEREPTGHGARYLGAVLPGFEREAAVLAELNHPGIVRYVAHGVTAEGGRYLALAWLDGETLARRLQRQGLTIAETIALGAPTDQAACAARCALTLRAALPDAPMALATGRGQAGERAPVGDVLDRAVSLVRVPASERDAEASPRPIRIDEITAGLLGARFDVGIDGAGLLLRAERETAAPQRTLLGRPTACVGRDRELAMLDALLEECIAEPRARAVVVTGSAGIGKSRLLHELLARIGRRAAPVEVWTGQGDAISAGSPFVMIAPALRRSAGVLEGEPASLRRQKLRARVGRHIGREVAAWPTPAEADLPRMIEFLGELAGVPFPDEESVQLRAARRDAMLMGDQMRRAWIDLLAAECAAHPLVLVLEDLQWGDLPSVKFVDAALRSLKDAPLLVLALARPEVRELFPDLWAEREPESIHLSSLGRRASERLVRDALGPSADDATVARLIDRAAGNAFYLEELIRAVAEGEGERLPETVLAMVELRLDSLPAEGRRVLRAASVFGEVFWRGAVAALLGGEERTTDVARLLAALAEREVITRRGEARFPGEEEFAFRHALVREAAYAMLTDEDRSLGHRLAGTWLELSGEQNELVLAEHFERGGDRVRAPVWYWRAAAEELEANDFAGALVCAGRGVACGADGETLGALHLIEAEAHKWRGENAEAEISALKAMSLLPRGSAPWYAATGEVAVASLRLGRVGRLAETVEELRFCLVTSGASPAAVMAAARSATGLAHAGAYDLAEPLLELAEALVEGLPSFDPAVQARIVQARATLSLASGDVGDYLHRMSRAAALFEDAGEVRMACNARVGVGYAYLEVGAHAEAERCLSEARAGAERMGLPQIAAAAAHNLGLVLARTGAIAEGRAAEAEVAEAFRRQHDLRLEAASRSYLAQILVLAGDLDAAEREAREAAALPVPPPVRIHALAALAHALLAAGRPGEALVASREATALLATLGGTDTGESLLRLVHAEALHAAGEEAAARTAILIARRRILERVPENARTQALADAWRDGAGPNP